MLFVFRSKRTAEGRRLLTGRWEPVNVPALVAIAETSTAAVERLLSKSATIFRWVCPD
jgi:RES domain-containing protein